MVTLSYSKRLPGTPPPSSYISSHTQIQVYLPTCFYGITAPPHGARAPSGPGPPHYRCFTITLRHITFGRTPLDEWSARRRDLYLTTHNRQTSMPSAGFEPAIPASERPQTHALDRGATGIGWYTLYSRNIIVKLGDSQLMAQAEVKMFTRRLWSSTLWKSSSYLIEDKKSNQ
jgi:hypothetical protein